MIGLALRSFALFALSRAALFVGALVFVATGFGLGGFVTLGAFVRTAFTLIVFVAPS